MISIWDLFVKHTYKHNSHIKLMYIYIYIPVGKRAYFEIYSVRYIFNENTCFLCLSGHFK